MKKYIALILILTLILPNAVFLTAFADEEPIIITTGQEFVASVVSENFGKEFVIWGTEILDDGSLGIILPDNFASVEGFYGKLTGTSDKNNIQMSSKSLFSTFGAGETVVDNLVLKGAEMSPTDNTKHFGVLVSSITDVLAEVEIKNIINYVNISSPYRRLALGAIVGFVKNTGIILDNCMNFGNIVCSHEYIYCGGILGAANNAGDIVIKNCANYGNFSGSKAYNYLGGIYGGTLEYNVTSVPATSFALTRCANYGDMTTSTSTSAYSGGIATLIYKATISECFNIGNVISGGRYAAGILAIARSTTPGDTLVTDCFNLGKVMGANSSSLTLKLAESPCGIASAYDSGNRDGVIVKNSYNMGVMDEKAPLFTKTLYYNLITNSKSTACENNYQTTQSSKDGYIAPETLAASLPANYSSDIWDYVEVDGVDGEYVYPQLKNNIYWNDYKYFGLNDNIALTSSSTSGEITDISTGWEKADNSNVYMSSPLGYDISKLASYGGVANLPMLRGDMASTSSLCSFKINKSAEIYIATDKNPSVDTVSAVTDGGFTQVFNSDNSPATIVTRSGAQFYLSKKSIVVSGNELKTVSIGNATGLDKSYFVFVNWLDNGTLSLDLSGDENVYINNELYSGTTYTVAKGSTIKFKVEPKQNYYIKDFIIDGESEEQNITTYYEKNIDIADDITIKSETSLYEFIDEDLTDDEISPDYQLVQEIENGTGLTIQSIKAEGYLGEFLEGSIVTLNVKKGGSLITTAQGTVNGYGKVQITASVGNTEGDCTLSFTVNVSGNVNDIYLDDSKKTFNVPSVADVNNLISNVNTSQITALDLAALILEERPTLAFKTNVFKELDPAIQNKIASDILTNTDYNVSNLYSSFDNFVIMNTLNMTKDKEDIVRLLDTYVLETWIDFSMIYNDYMVSDDKSGVCEYMVGVEYPDISYILPQFEYAFVKNKLSDLVSYDKILSELDNYDTVLGIESKVATALSKNINEIKVINEGIGENLPSLTTKELFVAKLDYLILNASQILIDKTTPILPPPLPPVISGGSVGGGGGGGGGNVSVSDDYIEVPEVKPVEQNGDNAFMDLGDVSWAYDSISKLFYKGILKGKEPAKFCPQDKVTRAEFVKMAVTAFNLEIENPVCDFTDLPKDHWAYKYVASMSDIGLISGYSATEFGTEESISRQDVIAILIRIIYRLARYEEMENRKNPGVSFADEKEIADYALGGVTMFAGNGIISGYEDGSFRPTQDLTRAEAAVILNNVIEFFRI